MSIGKKPDGYGRMSGAAKENGGRMVPDGWHTMTDGERALGGKRPPDGWSRMTERERERIIEDHRRKSGGYWP